jgi:hypothetical protein
VSCVLCLVSCVFCLFYSYLGLSILVRSCLVFIKSCLLLCGLVLSIHRCCLSLMSLVFIGINVVINLILNCYAIVVMFQVLTYAVPLVCCAISSGLVCCCAVLCCLLFCHLLFGVFGVFGDVLLSCP